MFYGLAEWKLYEVCSMVLSQYVYFYYKLPLHFLDDVEDVEKLKIAKK